MNKTLSIIFIFFIINSCSYPEMVRNEVVFENDFESKNLTSIDGGGLFSIFNNSKVLGDFNNDGFQYFLKILALMITFFFHLIYIFMVLGMVILMDFKTMTNRINGL